MAGRDLEISIILGFRPPFLLFLACSRASWCSTLLFVFFVLGHHESNIVQHTQGDSGKIDQHSRSNIMGGDGWWFQIFFMFNLFFG